MVPKTRKDYELDVPPWLVENWFPLGHRGMDTAPEGSFKTILGCWTAVCVASGTPIFGYPVNQGPVMMVDEETPEESLKYHLERFSAGLGYEFSDLPIHIFSMTGFRFARKTKMDDLLKLIDVIDPVFIRLDSLLAMLPSGNQAISENDCHLGEIIRDDLNKLVTPRRSILLAAHAKKYIADLTFDEIENKEMQSIVRGHGSVVGEGCDTGYIIKKLSEHPNPTRFALITVVRRQAIPGKKIKYIEMKEERYGEGWARLEQIMPSKFPPSKQAMEVYQLFKIPSKKTGLNHSSQWILRQMAFRNKDFCRIGVEELLKRKVILNPEPQHYELNLKMTSQCDHDYLRHLDPTILP